MSRRVVAAAVCGVLAGTDRAPQVLVATPDRDLAARIAAQLRDAGIPVKRTILPGSTFWNDWTKYPFSSTNWNHRPLGVQIWALAYRSGEAWNEFGWSNPEFDAILTEAGLRNFESDPS